ncbi:MAG: hypothetical protein NVSMB49_08750 [Ktedonobacteraceae bacterium]
MQSRGKLTTIVPIAFARIGSDPLTSMHLQSSGPCTNHLTSLAPFVARRTDRIESAFCSRERRIAWECSLPCRLAGGIDSKDDVTMALPIPHTANRLGRPPIGKALLLEKRAERF